MLQLVCEIFFALVFVFLLYLLKRKLLDVISPCEKNEQDKSGANSDDFINVFDKKTDEDTENQ